MSSNKELIKELFVMVGIFGSLIVLAAISAPAFLVGLVLWAAAFAGGEMTERNKWDTARKLTEIEIKHVSNPAKFYEEVSARRQILSEGKDGQ